MKCRSQSEEHLLELRFWNCRDVFFLVTENVTCCDSSAIKFTGAASDASRNKSEYTSPVQTKTNASGIHIFDDKIQKHSHGFDSCHKCITEIKTIPFLNMFFFKVSCKTRSSSMRRGDCWQM